METIKQPFPTSKDLTKTSSNWYRQLFFYMQIFRLQGEHIWCECLCGLKKSSFFVPGGGNASIFGECSSADPWGGMIEFDDCRIFFSSWVGWKTNSSSAFGVLFDFFQARCGPQQDWLKVGARRTCGETLGCFPKGPAVNEGLQPS